VDLAEDLHERARRALQLHRADGALGLRKDVALALFEQLAKDL